MDFDTIYGFIIYSIQFLLPVVMIFFYKFKTTKLSKFYIMYYIALIIILFTHLSYMVIRRLDFSTFILYSPQTTLYLVTFYGLIGLSFTAYLIMFKNWEFPQAFSIAVLCTAIGTYFWEIPTNIYNLFTVGYEVDIFLPLVGLLFFFFILTTCGWKSDNRTKLVVVSSLIISILFLYFRSPLPPSIGKNLSYYWNSPYFMTNRFISTMIVIYCVNKNKPMEKSK